MHHSLYLVLPLNTRRLFSVLVLTTPTIGPPTTVPLPLPAPRVDCPPAWGDGPPNGVGEGEGEGDGDGFVSPPNPRPSPGGWLPSGPPQGSPWWSSFQAPFLTLSCSVIGSLYSRRR